MNRAISITVKVATTHDSMYAKEIVTEMEASAKLRGTGISKRSPASVIQKMEQGRVVIAITPTGEWVGYIHLDIWANGTFVSHGGLIVSPRWRRLGVATAMKEQLFKHTRILFPEAKIFGITTTLATMKINTRLGMQPVTFAEIVNETAFWDKCKSCINYDRLKATGFKNCFCTAMLFEPEEILTNPQTEKHLGTS